MKDIWFSSGFSPYGEINLEDEVCYIHICGDPECYPYIRKYFDGNVRLPGNWILV